MRPTHKRFLDLVAADLMTREIVLLAQDMPLREAVRQLQQHHVSGAPVVDDEGRCVGVFSTTDVARLAVTRGTDALTGQPRPITCQFQMTNVGPDCREHVTCTLAQGSCPFQRLQTSFDGREEIVCLAPHTVLADWQVVQTEALPVSPIRLHMTSDPVTAAPKTPVRVLARMMLDAGIRRVIVTDAAGRPVGVISSFDVLAAVAYTADDCTMGARAAVAAPAPESERGSAMLPIRTILHPTDFSEPSAYALKMACAVARDYGARLVLAHIGILPTAVFAEGIVPTDVNALEGELWQQLERIEVPADVPVTRRLIMGVEPVTEVIHLAQSERADLIVVGTHGRSGLTRMLMGSVAEGVLREAPCPVLTVRQPVAFDMTTAEPVVASAAL